MTTTVRLLFLLGLLCPHPALSDEIPVSGESGIESEITIAINPNDEDELVIAAIGLGSGTNLVYHSEDAGLSWQQTSETFGAADPVLAYGDDGRVVLSYLDFGSTLEVFLARSTNNGVSFVTQALPLDGNAVDRQWIQIDNSPGSPSYGRTFMAYFHPVGARDIHFVSIEPDGTVGSNHPVHAQSYTYVQNPALDVAVDGVIAVCYLAQDAGGFSVQTALSIDGGTSFSPGGEVTPIHMFNSSGDPITDVVGFAPGAASRLGVSLQMAIDKSGGPYGDRIYLTWTDFVEDFPELGMDVYLSYSDDRGLSWSAPSVVNDDGVVGTHQYYAGIDVNGVGTVSICWYDRREDPVDDAITDFYFTYSEDGASTFHPSVKVNSASSDHAAITTGPTTFGVGEYTGIASSTTHAYPAWADGRNNDGEMDVYVAKMSFDTMTAVEEVRLLSGLRLSDPLPNPTRGRATLSYSLPRSGKARLLVFDAMGKRLETIVDDFRSRGVHSASFETGDLAVGTYFLRLEFGQQVDSKKLVVTR